MYINGDVYSTKINIPYSDVKTYELYARFKALYTVEAKAMYNNENVVTAGTVKVGNEKADKISSKPVMEGNDVKVEAIAKKVTSLPVGIRTRLVINRISLKTTMFHL